MPTINAPDAAGSIAPACEEVPVSAVVPDFDERRDRGRGRSKTPPEAATSLDRQEICTTRHQSAPEFLQHRVEKTVRSADSVNQAESERGPLHDVISTRRTSVVLIRARKPCFFARRC